MIRKFAWRTVLALMLALAMMTGMLSAGFASEADGTAAAGADASGRFVLAFNNVVDGVSAQKREPYLEALRTMLLPLMNRALTQGREVGLVYVDGQNLNEKLSGRRLEDGQYAQVVDNALRQEGGSTNKVYTNFNAAFTSLTAHKLMQGADELWYVMGFGLFADEVNADGSFSPKSARKMADTMGKLIKLLQDHPALKVNFVWYGKEELEDGEAYFSQENIARELKRQGIDADRVKVYVLEPGNALISETSLGSAVGVVRDALEMPLVASGVNVTKNDARAWTIPYTHTVQGSGMLRLTAVQVSAQVRIDSVTVTPMPGSSPVTAPLRVLMSGNEAWVDLDGLASGQSVVIQVNTASDASLVKASAYLHTSSVQVQTVADAESRAPQDTFAWLQNEAKLVVALQSPDVRPADLAVTVLAGEEPVQVQMQAQAARDRSDVWLMTLAMPTLPVGSGELKVQIAPTNPRSMLTVPELPAAYTVRSRAPEIVNDDSAATLYTNVPGQKDKPLTFDMNAHFADPEGEALTFRLQGSDGHWALDPSGILSFTGAPDTMNKTSKMTVVAQDVHGELAQKTFEVTHKDALKEFNTWAFRTQTGSQQLTGCVEEAYPLTLTLSDALAAYDEIAAQYGLGALEQVLTVKVASLTIDGTPAAELPACTLTRAEDKIVLTAEMPVQQSNAHVSVAFDAQMGGQQLNALVPALTINYENVAPELGEGLKTLVKPEEEPEIDDLADNPELNLLSGNPGGQSVVPNELFSDANTPHIIIYRVKTTGGAQLYLNNEPAPTIIDEAGEEAWELNWEQGQQPLDVRVHQAGEATVSLSARDTGGLVSEDTVVWQFNVASRKSGMITMAAIIAGVVLVLIVILLIIRYKTRPQFRGVTIVMTTPFSENLTLPLTYWGARSVTMAQVAIAAQMPPMQQLPVSMLAKIDLAPARGKKFILKASGEAENIAAYVDTVQVSLRKGAKFTAEQKVTLYVGQQAVLRMMLQHKG